MFSRLRNKVIKKPSKSTEEFDVEGKQVMASDLNLNLRVMLSVLLIMFVLFPGLLVYSHATDSVKTRSIVRSRPKTLPLKKFTVSILQMVIIYFKTTCKEVAQLTDMKQIMEDSNRISVVRVSDTPKHQEVQDYIVSRFREEWEVTDSSDFLLLIPSTDRKRYFYRQHSIWT